MALSLDILASTAVAQAEMKALADKLEDVKDRGEEIADASKRASDAFDKWKAAESVEEAEDALSDLLTELHDLGTASGRTGEEIATDFQKIGLSAEDAEDAVKAIEDSAVRAGDKTGSIGDKAGDVGEGLRSLGDVAKSVLSGDFAGAAEGALDALGGIATAAGVGGAVGGAVASALSGLVSVLIEELTKFSEQSKEATQGVLNDFIEFGDGLDQEAIGAKVKGIFGDEDALRQANLLKDLLGTDLPSAVLAMAGDFESAGVDVDEVMKAIADAPGNVSLDDYYSLKATLDGTLEGLEQGPGIANNYAEAMSLVAIRSAEAAVAAGDATVSIDDLGQKVYQMPDGKVVVIDAETGQARADIQTVNDYKLDAKKQGIVVEDDEALKDLTNVDQYALGDKTTTVRVNVDSSAWDNYTPQSKTAYVNPVTGRTGNNNLDFWE